MTTTGARAIIFTGGRLDDWALKYIQPGDLLIGADNGAAYLTERGYSLYAALGDFDSVTDSMKESIRANSGQFIECDPVMKDASDTQMAFEFALRQNPAAIVICGALGSRFDHSLSNVQLLVKALDRRIDCMIADEHNEITIAGANRPVQITRKHFAYASLLPLSSTVTGVTLEGFRYPLDNATLTLGNSLSVSNELIADEGVVSIQTGKLLVIQSKDECD